MVSLARKCAAAGAILLLLGSAGAAIAGTPPASCPEAPASDAGDWRARVEASRQRYLAFACQARLDVARRAAERARLRGGSGKLEDFLRDDTLQRGDVIVTDRGFRIYTGGEAPAMRDFEPVKERKSKPALRRALDELEKASAR